MTIRGSCVWLLLRLVTFTGISFANQMLHYASTTTHHLHGEYTNAHGVITHDFTMVFAQNDRRAPRS
uniref:Putative secreted peptide n=1 Tax=Anopheles braziliensis TaxID=58242 RepID=A0A2M3ZQH6_9DIPT